MIAIKNAITIEVTKTVKDAKGARREHVGFVTMFSPSLRDFGIEVDPVSQDEKTGELTYADIKVQWLYNSVLAAVKANARNKLQTGSISLKPNNKFAETLEELVTPSENASTVLADRRALLDMFKGYLATLDKPDNVKRLLLSFLEKPDTLALQPTEQRAKIQTYFEEFGGAVEDKLTEWQGEYLVNVIAQCTADAIEF
jgi:hypothetical protein